MIRNKIKVCHLTSAHAAFDVRIFHKECKSLAETGFDVHLVAPNDSDTIVDGVNVHAMTRQKGRLKRRTKTLLDVYKKAIEIRADIYHFHDPELIPIGLLLQCKGANVIYDVHEDYPAAINLRYYIPKGMRSLISIGFSIFEKITARFMSGIITADKGTAERFKDHPNVIILYNFPLISLFRNFKKNKKRTISNEQDIVVHIGGISPNYGLFVLLEMVKVLVKNYHLNICLLFVGACDDPELRESISQFLITHEIEKNVRITGRVPHQDVLSYAVNAKLGMIGLQPHPKYRVNIPTKMFEYMACGIPFVGSDLPTIRQFSGSEEKPCGILVHPESAEAFAFSTKKLIDNPEYANELGKNGREYFLTKYNWKKQEKKLIDFYDRMLINDCLE